MSTENMTTCWDKLDQLGAEVSKNLNLRKAFANDPARFDRFQVALDDPFVDYSKNLITDVEGLKVGSAADLTVKTGATVLTAGAPFTAGVAVMGGAPGTRETDLLAPDRLVQKVDALALSGGSAFGLDAASGAMEALAAEDLVYPAFMCRGEIKVHVERFEEEEGRPWPRDPDGAPLYPGLDRHASTKEREKRMSEGERFAWRLDVERAIEMVPALTWDEHGASPLGESGTIVARPLEWGDVVLGRMDIPTSYHLSVVVDDAIQGITDVVRGRDLFYATSIQRLLQALLGLDAPRYHHHELILGVDGRKLSKSARDTSLRSLRQAGLTAEDIRRMVGLPGRPEGPEEMTVVRPRGSSAIR